MRRYTNLTHVLCLHMLPVETMTVLMHILAITKIFNWILKCTCDVSHFQFVFYSRIVINCKVQRTIYFKVDFSVNFQKDIRSQQHVHQTLIVQPRI